MDKTKLIYKFKSVIFVIPFIFFMNVSSWATTYYVDFNSGDNSNDGTSGSPWKEIPGTQNPTDIPSSGWVTIQAGDEIIFTAGQTWNRPVMIDSIWFANPSNESGRITLRSSSTSTRAIFDFTGVTTSYGFQVRRDYISLEYLEIRDITNAGNAHAIYIGNVDANDYVKVRYCYIHDITDSNKLPTEQFTSGITLVWSTGSEVSYNIIKNVDKKFISTSEVYSDSYKIHHNVFYNESGYSGDPMDHGIVLSGQNHKCYNNIIWNDHADQSYASFAIKIDGDNSEGSANNNNIYNNLILKWAAGIGILDTPPSGGNNVVHNNTIYLQDKNCSGSCSGYILNGITIGGSGDVSYNSIRNNIIYYARPNTTTNKSTCMFICSASSTCSNNTITNNLCFYSASDGSDIDFRVNSNYRILSWLETNGNWNGVNGNVMENNIIANPGFMGDNHPVFNLPTGFNASGHPNNTGLNITSSSSVKDRGYPLVNSFDIRGVQRPYGSAWDIGAYEFFKQPSPPISN